MTKLIWLTDVHFMAEGYVMGFDPRARLEVAIDLINAHHGDAQYCVITGDLVDAASAKDYEALALALTRLRVPVLPLIGNHDHRDLARGALSLPDGVMPDFVQYALDLGDQMLIALDTLDQGQDTGLLCAARLDWLADVIARAGDKSLRIFMHHSPVHLGLSMMDQLDLGNAEGFWQVIGQAKGAVSIHAGHVHRATLAHKGAVPVMTLPALIYQAQPERPAWDWKGFTPPAEAAQYGIMTLNGHDFAMHIDQLCAAPIGQAL